MNENKFVEMFLMFGTKQVSIENHCDRDALLARKITKQNINTFVLIDIPIGKKIHAHFHSCDHLTIFIQSP